MHRAPRVSDSIYCLGHRPGQCAAPPGAAARPAGRHPLRLQSPPARLRGRVFARADGCGPFYLLLLAQSCGQSADRAAVHP